MQRTYKRRNFFIKKDFQGKLILGYFLFVSGGCLLFLFVIGFFSADTLTISYDNHNLQLGQTPAMLLKETLAAHWVFIVIGSIFLVIAAMLITHRIAGPLFRFEKALDNMLAKRLDDTIYLRTKDEGKELAKKINEFNTELSLSLTTIQHQTDAIAQLLEQARSIAGHLPTERQDEMNGIFWSLEEKNKRIKAISSSYTIKDA